MKTETITGWVQSWHHEPDGRGCFVKVSLGTRGAFDMKATPELVDAAKRGAKVKVSIEFESETICPCCGPIR